MVSFISQAKQHSTTANCNEDGHRNDYITGRAGADNRKDFRHRASKIRSAQASVPNDLCISPYFLPFIQLRGDIHIPFAMNTALFQNIQV